METVLSDYAGSRQDFFQAHLDVEKAEKLIKELVNGKSGSSSSSSSASHRTSHTFDDNSSPRSSISW